MVSGKIPGSQGDKDQKKHFATLCTILFFASSLLSCYFEMGRKGDSASREIFCNRKSTTKEGVGTAWEYKVQEVGGSDPPPPPPVLPTGYAG